MFGFYHQAEVEKGVESRVGLTRVERGEGVAGGGKEGGKSSQAQVTLFFCSFCGIDRSGIGGHLTHILSVPLAPPPHTQATYLLIQCQLCIAPLRLAPQTHS